MYLVSAAYSLLVRSVHQGRPHDGARQTLRTIGEACRAVKSELLDRLVDWIVDTLSNDPGAVPQTKAVLIRP